MDDNRWMRRAAAAPPSAVARWALISAAAGVLANLLLILFFAIAQPWRPEFSGQSWLGTTNDVVMIAQFGALVPVALGLRNWVSANRLARAAAGAAAVASSAIVVLQVLLVGGFLDFIVEAPLVTLCTLVVFGWVLITSRHGHRTGVLPRGLTRLGTLLALGFAAGMLLVLPALLLPAGSLAQYIGFGVGLVAGASGWLAFPIWVLLLARHFGGDHPSSLDHQDPVSRLTIQKGKS
jgi:hypothetical protein